MSLVSESRLEWASGTSPSLRGLYLSSLMDDCLVMWISSGSEVGSYLLRSHSPSGFSSSLTVQFLLCTIFRGYPYQIAWIELVWYPTGLTSCTDSLFL